MTDEMPETFRARLDAALSRPVMLDARAVDGVRAAAGFSPNGDGGSPQEPFVRMNGVAVVDICGPLAQRAWACWMFAGDGYDAILARVSAALDDRSTTAVLLRINSPGGEVAGCFEAVRAIRAAAAKVDKPLVAFADEMACSAAYAIASAAGAIVLPDTGVVGSIGVIAVCAEQSRALDAMGVTVTVLTSGARKADGHPAVPMTDAARAALQSEIDYLAGVFAEEVAAARGLTAEAVLGLDAGVFYGPAAVDAKLADRVGSINDALELARQQGAAQRTRATMEKIKQALGLKADASESDILASIDTRARAQLEIQQMLGVEDQAGVKGAIAALKTRGAQSDEFEKALTTATAQLAEHDRNDLIESGKRDGKLSPAMIANLVPELETSALRTFLKHAPRVVPADPQLKEPPAGIASARIGATWGDMKPADRARLFQEDPEAYAALKAAASDPSASAPSANLAVLRAKSWEDLKPAEKHTLYVEDRATYDAKKAAATR